MYILLHPLHHKWATWSLLLTFIHTCNKNSLDKWLLICKSMLSTFPIIHCFLLSLSILTLHYRPFMLFTIAALIPLYAEGWFTALFWHSKISTIMVFQSFRTLWLILLAHHLEGLQTLNSFWPLSKLQILYLEAISRDLCWPYFEKPTASIKDWVNFFWLNSFTTVHHLQEYTIPIQYT